MRQIVSASRPARLAALPVTGGVRRYSQSASGGGSSKIWNFEEVRLMPFESLGFYGGSRSHFPRPHFPAPDLGNWMVMGYARYF